MIQLLHELAVIAMDKDEVPIGAAIVKDGEIIAEAVNHVQTLHDPTMHAEMIAIQEASEQLENQRLLDCDLYTTLEPCVMCAGAIVHARIKNVYYLAKDPKWGAFGSLYSFHNDGKLNHQVNVVQLEDDGHAADTLKQFFQSKRTTTP